MNGNCVSSPFGPISTWDTSRVADVKNPATAAETGRPIV
eukprot:SAG22_NODE_13395_length_408_cov_0.873786_1_plen_38_part_01